MRDERSEGEKRARRDERLGRACKGRRGEGFGGFGNVVEHSASNVQRRNLERRGRILEGKRKTSNIEHRTFNIEVWEKEGEVWNPASGAGFGTKFETKFRREFQVRDMPT